MPPRRDPAKPKSPATLRRDKSRALADEGFELLPVLVRRDALADSYIEGAISAEELERPINDETRRKLGEFLIRGARDAARGNVDLGFMGPIAPGFDER